MKFSYILNKISDAEIVKEPFPHIELKDLFEPSDFQELISASDIKIPPAKDDTELFNILFENNYRIINFPGCTEDQDEYIEWHRDKQNNSKMNSACEGFGVVLRLLKAKSEPINELMAFLNSIEFIECIARKFDVEPEDCNYDCGIQKYLDGYEISPHPDIRRKALTYMVNINPNIESHNIQHHTHYMKFKSEFDYIRAYWKGNEEIDTSWVPWHWCDSIKQQTLNNSLVIFSPREDTLHAVKANYLHLENQRTQLYGNLWYKENPAKTLHTKWENLQIQHEPLKRSISEKIEGKIKRAFSQKRKKNNKSSKNTHSDRSY